VDFASACRYSADRMKTDPVTAVAEAPDRHAEMQLVREAAAAGTRDHWKVGDAVSKWHRRFGKGRSDAEFAGLVNDTDPDADFTPDYVRRCRNVFDAFPQRTAALSWSHHLRALEGSAGNRDKAKQWLERAAEGEWSVRDLIRMLDEERAATEASEFQVISDGGAAVADPFLPGNFVGGAPEEDPVRQAARSRDDSVEVVRIEPVFNEAVIPPPARPAGPLAMDTLPEAAPPEQVSTWLRGLLEQPAVLLHHQILRRIERVITLPPADRKEVRESIDRLMTTLQKIREALA